MIQVYRQGNAQFKLDSRNPLNWRCVTKAQLERKAMEQDAVAVNVVSVAPCGFQLRDYIIVDERPYFLNVMPKVTKDGKRKLVTELTFEGGIFELGRVTYTMAGLRGWDFTGELDDFCTLVVNEMNRNSLVGTMQGHLMRSTGRIVQGKYEWKDTTLSNTYYYSQTQIPANGDMLYTLNNLPHSTISNVGGGWTLDFEQEWNGKEYVDVPTEEKFLTYDNHTCLAVMHNLVTEWEDWEFAVDMRANDLCNIDGTVPTQCGGKIIVRRKSTGIFIAGVNTNHLNMKYGESGGLERITVESEDGKNLPSRIYFYGGTRNLPTTYRNTRLCMTGKKKEESYIDTDFGGNEHCEAVKVFDDIYPACEPFKVSGAGMSFMEDNHFTVSMFGQRFFDLFAKWANPNDSPEYGSYTEWNKMYGTGDPTTDMQRYLLYYYQGNSPGLGWSSSDDSVDVIERCRQESIQYQPTPQQGVVSDQVEYEGYDIEYTSREPIPAGEPTEVGQEVTGTRTARITIHMLEKIEYEGGQVTENHYDDVYDNETVIYTYTAVASSASDNFPKSCYLLGDVTITFQTGDLAGHSFKVIDFDNSYAPLWYALKLECEGVESALPETENPTWFPNIDIMCKQDDKFIVEGCLMPASYVYGDFGNGNYAAETMLDNAARDYIVELASKIKVGVEISKEYIRKHPSVKFRLYDGLRIVDTDLDLSTTYKVRRVVNDLLANSYKVEIDDGKGRNPWASIAQYVRRLSKR